MQLIIPTRTHTKFYPFPAHYPPQSEKYDRSRLSSFFGNTTTLALAWFFTGRDEYALHAADNIRAWFLDKATKMNPHMRFAQLRMGHKKDIDNGGFQSGIIETKVCACVLCPRAFLFT